MTILRGPVKQGMSIDALENNNITLRFHRKFEINLTYDQKYNH